MPACATTETIDEILPGINYILPIPDTEFRNFIEEIERLPEIHPEILKAIEKDLDANAREKKRIRLADKKFHEGLTSDFPDIHVEETELSVNEIEIGTGRPRMSANLVYLFIMIRGFLGGSLSSKESKLFLTESMSLYAYLENLGLKRPGTTTILDNINQISLETLNLIFDAQIKYVLKEDLDDFLKSTIDSTAVRANSSWPTDAKVLTGLLMRADKLGQKMEYFDLDNFRQFRVPSWLKEMDKLVFQICLAAGKAKSKGKLKKHYRKLLKRGRKTANTLTTELNRFEEELRMESLPPSRRILMVRLLDQIKTDLADANRVAQYADERVFHGKTLPAKEKILSLSDGSAAYIKKGSRLPIIGYKPQLVRSENGFVTSLTVPQGNTADSNELVPAIQCSIDRTGVIAELVSTDDGYASADGRNKILDMGVKDISISGAKGKKLTDIEVWESETYKNARGDRSAVESLMFTIKFGFDFGELSRRGIDAVQSELTEKVLAYNFCRIILVRKRHREFLDKAA